MKKHVFLFVIVFFSSCTLHTRKEIQPESGAGSQPPLTLVFAGDVMHHLPQMYASYVPETNSLDYTPCFKFIRPLVQKADLAFCNLETSLGGKPFSGYPRFSSPDELLFALKDAGFDVVQIANNHVFDRKRKGLERTIQLIHDQGLYHTGAFISKDQRDTLYPLIITLKGVKIAVLNFTYGTNGLNVEEPSVVNKLDTIQILADIRKCERLSADIIIMLAHWGDEYYLKSNEIQRKTADFCIKNGVDFIAGTHPHVVQEVSFYENKEKNKLVPVFYSLGNLISNQTDINRNGGILANVRIDTQSKSITSVSITPVFVYKGYLNQKRQYYLIPTVDFVKEPVNYQLPQNDSLSLITFHQNIQARLKNVKIEK